MPRESNLFVLELYNRISEYIKEKGRATIEELTEALYVSPATIRRDLNEMQRLGMLKRTHGGAIHIDTGDEVSIFVRMDRDGEEKERAASVALAHLPAFTSVFIDNSSTCLCLAEKMDLSFKTVVTNGMQLVNRIAGKKDIDLILLGGVVYHNGEATRGPFAVEMLQMFRFDLMLMGAASVRPDGAYEHSLETVEIKRAAYARSNHHILVVGQSKFEIPSTYRVRDLEGFDLICTDAPTAKLHEYKERGIHVVNK